MKLTEVEKIILENTDKKYKYIVRNEFGALILFGRKPVKVEQAGSWKGLIYSFMHPFYHLFQGIKWEDKEPYKFRKKRKMKKD